MYKINRLISPNDAQVRYIQGLVKATCYSDYYYRLQKNKFIKRHIYFMGDMKIEPLNNIVLEVYTHTPKHSDCEFLNLNFSQFVEQVKKFKP